MNLLKQVQVRTMVSCPNVSLEFNSFYIKQIVRNCHVLFSLRGVMDVVEIWRKQHAIAVKHVFTVDISQEQSNARMSLSGLTGHKCGMTR